MRFGCSTIILFITLFFLGACFDNVQGFVCLPKQHHSAETSALFLKPNTCMRLPHALLSVGAKSRNNKVVLYATKDDSDNDDNGEAASSSTRRKRVRRKQNNIDDNKQEQDNTDTDTISLTPRDDDTPVQLKVQSIQDLVGTPSASSTTDAGNSNNNSNSATTQSTSKNQFATPSSSSSNFDTSNYEVLLQDAKELQEKQQGALVDNEPTTIKGKIGNVLSTIVTIDFFVVCAFLVWFLVGIVASSIFKDDTIQIAFNNNFEKLVQPALGVLMIASIAGNFFKEDEEQAF